MSSNLMEAELLFLTAADMERAIPTLIELGFKIEVLHDRIDDLGPTIWCRAWIVSDLSQEQFLDWVLSLVDPFRGDVYEAGFAHPPGFA
jgi:hypothetical protein